MTRFVCGTCGTPRAEAVSFVQGRTRDDLDRDRQLVLALVMVDRG